MSTLAQIRTNIADYLLRTDLNSQINTAINRAIEYYETEHFWFNTGTGTFTTVVSQQTYSSSAASFIGLIAEIDLIRLTLSSSNIYTLKLISYGELLTKDTGNFISSPEEYAFYNQSIYLYPTPNDTLTVTVSYQKKYAELTLDADTNDFITYARDLIEQCALYWIYANILVDTDRADIAKKNEMQSLSALRIKTNKLTSTGQICHTDF